MTYKNKIKILLSVIAVLSLLYAGSFIFTPERTGKRSSSYAWLDEKLSGRVNKIVIKTAASEIELVNRQDMWYSLFDAREYPARQNRIEDFIGIFTKRDAWPVHSNNASSHAGFGLEAQEASRVTFYDKNTILLDILIGYDNISESGVYLRKNAQNEVRSGDSGISTYVTSPATSWCNLRLFPEGDAYGADNVQRLTVTSEGQTRVFTRSQRTWTISGTDIQDPDRAGIEEYIRTILNTQGEDFILVENIMYDSARIEIEFSNAAVSTVNFCEKDEAGNRLARVSGADYVYYIPSWACESLFMDASSFAR